MKIKCEILATFRNNPYLCTVKCMFDYPGRIPRGANLIDNALGARHHDTTPFLKPSPDWGEDTPYIRIPQLFLRSVADSHNHHFAHHQS